MCCLPLTGWALHIIHSPHVRFFSLQGDRLPWANLSQLPPMSCWRARAWYLFPVQCHLWVRIAKQKPLLICTRIPVHFLFLIHSDITKGEIFMLFSLRTLLFCLQSSFFLHACAFLKSAKQFSISIFNSIYFSIYSAHLRCEGHNRLWLTKTGGLRASLPNIQNWRVFELYIPAPKQTSLDLNTTLCPFSWHFKSFKWFCSPTT